MCLQHRLKGHERELQPLLWSSPQFFDRIKLFGMPAKHQPDLIYLRYVPLWKVHVFTLVQLTCLVLLWVIKASAAAVVFPMMVPPFSSRSGCFGSSS